MRSRTRPEGFTLIELLIAVAVIAVLAAFAIPNLVRAQQRAKYARGAADTKAAVTEAIAYGMDRTAYPTSLQGLRETGYGNVPDADPWGRPYLLAPVFSGGSTPAQGDDVYVYSPGPSGTDTYRPDIPQTGPDGAVGFSSVYGSFTGN